MKYHLWWQQTMPARGKTPAHIVAAVHGKRRYTADELPALMELVEELNKTWWHPARVAAERGSIRHWVSPLKEKEEPVDE